MRLHNLLTTPVFQTPLASEKFLFQHRTTPFEREKNFTIFSSVEPKIILDNVVCKPKEDSPYNYDYIRMPHAYIVERKMEFIY